MTVNFAALRRKLARLAFGGRTLTFVRIGVMLAAIAFYGSSRAAAGLACLCSGYALSLCREDVNDGVTFEGIADLQAARCVYSLKGRAACLPHSVFTFSLSGQRCCACEA